MTAKCHTGRQEEYFATFRNLQKPQKTTQNRSYSLAKMSSQPKWRIEKNRILALPPAEKRKLYKCKNDFIVLESNSIQYNVIKGQSLAPWYNYATSHKEELRSKKHILDDLTEFKKINITQSMNKTLSQKVSIFKGDITHLEIDAIVNAANSRLKAGGGVDGAIHRAAGPFLQDECDSLQGCPTGEARITGGYNLPAKYVIHTVGPQDGSPEKLQACYENCFSILKKNSLTSIAFPCISTGIYGFPNRLACHIALSTARKELEANEDINRVIFCVFMPIDQEIYETLMQMYFPIHDWNYNDGASLTE